MNHKTEVKHLASVSSSESEDGTVSIHPDLAIIIVDGDEFYSVPVASKEAASQVNADAIEIVQKIGKWFKKDGPSVIQ